MYNRGFSYILILIGVTILVATTGYVFVTKFKEAPKPEEKSPVSRESAPPLPQEAEKSNQEEKESVEEKAPLERKPPQETKRKSTQAPAPLTQSLEQKPRPTTTSTPVVQPTINLAQPSGWIPPRGCSGDKVGFSAAPVDPHIITYIEPLGKMNGLHVTPTDHGYIHTDRDETSVFPAMVFAPAEGQIVEIGAFPHENDFRVVIWYSCTVSTIYIHLTSLAPEVIARTGNVSPNGRWFGDDNALKVSAGQPIGTMHRSVDFSVHDTNNILSGLVSPALYRGERWKIHTVDMFNYFAEPLRSQLRAKSLRTVEPLSGKIDYDIDGRLIGNWFLEGSDYSEPYGPAGHFAIAYDHVSPHLVRVALPNSGIDDAKVCNVCFNVYGAKGNTPDPAGVNVDTGLVRYELVAREHVDDLRLGVRTYTRNVEDKILGVLLIEMLGRRRIKVEVFPGKTSGEIGGFTNSARIYER